MTDLDEQLKRIELIAFTFDMPGAGAVSSEDVRFLIEGYRSAIASIAYLRGRCDGQEMIIIKIKGEKKDDQTST